MGTEVGSVEVKIKANKSEFSSGLNSAKSEFSGFASDLQSRADRLGSAIGGALKTGLMAGGAAAVAGATLGLKSFADLESTAADAAAKAVDVSGKSVDQIKAQYDGLKEHVMAVSRELGASTVFDPTQVAGAFQEIAAGGKDVSKVGTNELRPFLDLAASDMEFGLIPSTKLAMSVMNQFGLSMEDSGRIADVLAKGAAGSGAGLGDFATALEYVGPVAATTGVSLEEVTAMIGKVRDAGIDASTAGTALRSSFLQLANPTKPMVEALDKLGLKFEDIDPRTHSFIDTLDLLKSKGANAFDLEALFGKESVSVVTTLMGATQEVRSFTTELENASGVAKVMADLKLDGLTGDFENAKGAASDFFIEIGKQLEPTARDILKAFSKITPELTKALGKVKFSDLQKAAQTAFKVIAGAAGVGLVVKGLGTIAPAALMAAKSFGTMAVTAALEFAGISASALSARFAIIGTWAAALAPVAGVVAGIALITAGLAAVGYALNPGKFTTFGKVASDAFNGIKSVVTDVYNLISQGDFSGAANRLKQAFGDGLNFVKGLPWKALGGEVVEMVSDGAKAIINSAFKLGDWIYKTGKDWVDQGGPKRLGEDIVDTLAAAAQSLLKGQDLWGALKTAFKTAQDWVSLGWEIIKGIGTGILGKIKEYLAPAQNQFLEFVKSVGDAFFTLGENMATAIGNGLDEAGRKAAAFVTWVGRNVPGAAAVLSAAANYNAPTTYQGAPVYTKAQLKDMGISGLDIIGSSSKDQYYESTYAGGTVYKALTDWGKDDSKKQDKIANVLGEMYATTGETQKSIQSVALNTFASSQSLTAIKAQQAKSIDIYDSTTGLVFTKEGEIKTPTSATANAGIAGTGTALVTGKAPSTVSETQQNTAAISAAGISVDKDFLVEWKSLNDGMLTTIQQGKTAFDNHIDSLKWSTEQTTSKEIAGANEEVNIEAAGTRAGVDILKEGIFDTSVSFGQSLAQASQTVSQQLAAGSQAGARALQLGSEVAGKIHQSGIQNAVTLYQNANGQVCAAIGSVGQQFQQAGQTVSQSQITTSQQTNAALLSTQTQVNAYKINAQNQAAAIQLSGANQSGQALSAKIDSAGSGFQGDVSAAGDTIVSKTGTAMSSFANGVGQAAGLMTQAFKGMAFSSRGFPATYGSSGGSTNIGSVGTANQNFEDCFFEGFTDQCTNMNVNGLKYTNPAGQTYYINPMTYNSTGGINGYIGGSSGGGLPSGLTGSMPWAAKGADITEHQLVHVGEEGPELILDSKIRGTIVNLARMGFDAVRGPANAAAPVVQVFLGTEEVTDWIMRRVITKARAKGMRF